MYKRKLKTEKVDNILFVPMPLSLKERIECLKRAVLMLAPWDSSGIDSFSRREYASISLSEFETFLLGYRYRMYDLTKDEHYQMMKFVEWIETLDEDIRQAVLAEYRESLAHEDR